MAADFLEPFRAVLLDMNSTFMFDEDRFGPGENYGRTYRRLGYRRLGDSDVAQAIQGAYEYLAARYERPEFFTDFPTVAEALRAVRPRTSDRDLEELVAVFAEHECGTVTAEYRDALMRLAEHHRLALVTNIWAPSWRWRDELSRAGVFDLFGVAVFSSDGRAIKPAQHLFEEALRKLGVAPSEAVMIGDGFRCDVLPAAALGMATVLIGRPADREATAGVSPTKTVATLLDLKPPTGQ